ncbi:MAG: FG-GAP-like repeat-containing protein [Thermoplasmata archaeon]
MASAKGVQLLIFLIILLSIFTPATQTSSGQLSVRLISPKWVSEDISPYCWGIAAGNIFGDEHTVVLAGSADRVYGFSLENGTRVWESPILSGNVRKIAVGNVTGDARPEIAIATHDGHLSIVDALTNDVLLDWDKSHFTNGAIFGLQIVDIDGDGINEIIVGTGTASIGVYTYNAGILFTKGITMTPDAVFEVSVGDVDGDGRKDIVFVDWRGNTESTVRVLDYQHGQFTQKFISPYIPGILSALAVDDIDGDGVDEIIAGSGDGNIWIIKVGGLGAGAGGTTTLHICQNQIFGVAIGDFEGDGVKDIGCTTYDGYVYIVDIGTGAVKFRGEKEMTDLGNSNSVMFYRMPNTLKEVFITTESGIQEISPGKVLLYGVKNIEIAYVEYSPRLPEINQTVTFTIGVLSVAANSKIELNLTHDAGQGNEIIGHTLLENTIANREYNVTFTWIPKTGGYHRILLDCNADGEAERKNFTICVAVELEVYLTLGNHLKNEKLEMNREVAVKLGEGEVIEGSITLLNRARYSIFSVGVEIYIDSSIFMTKRFDIGTSETLTFKLDTLLITNRTFNITIKVVLMNIQDNSESIHSVYNITVKVIVKPDYAMYVFAGIGVLATVMVLLAVWYLVRRFIRRYKELWREESVEGVAKKLS